MVAITEHVETSFQMVLPEDHDMDNSENSNHIHSSASV